MSRRTWVVVDQASGTRADQLRVTPEQAGGPARGYSIEKRTLHGGASEGVDWVRLDNGTLAVDVIPTRGMGVWKTTMGEDEFGWDSPARGPVHPQHVPLMEPGGLGWLDGFGELLVRCGLESNGAPEFDENGRLKYPLHGRIANKPAHYVEVAVDTDSGELSITGVVDESRFHFQKLRLTTVLSLRPGQAGWTLVDRIENMSASPTEFQMLYHINFGPPLLDAGAQVIAPATIVVPRNDHAASGIEGWSNYPAPEAGYEEQVYFLNLAASEQGRTRAMLRNAHGTLGATIVYAPRDLPCFSLWKNTVPESDGCVTGLEPGTNFPNPRTFEGQHDRVVKLAAGASREFQLDLEFHNSTDQVAAAERAVAALSPGAPKIHPRPLADWCSD